MALVQPIQSSVLGLHWETSLDILLVPQIIGTVVTLSSNESLLRSLCKLERCISGGSVVPYLGFGCNPDLRQGSTIQGEIKSQIKKNVASLSFDGFLVLCLAGGNRHRFIFFIFSVSNRRRSLAICVVYN